MIQWPIWIMFDATQMPFYVKNNLILFKIDEKNWGRSSVQEEEQGYTLGKDYIIVTNLWPEIWQAYSC